jgi:hypothetical protein
MAVSEKWYFCLALAVTIVMNMRMMAGRGGRQVKSGITVTVGALNTPHS